jgi:hypothetical protein
VAVQRGVVECWGGTLTTVQPRYSISSSVPEAAVSLTAAHDTRPGNAVSAASVALATITIKRISSDACLAPSLAQLPGVAYDESRAPAAWVQVGMPHSFHSIIGCLHCCSNDGSKA